MIGQIVQNERHRDARGYLKNVIVQIVSRSQSSYIGVW